MAEITNGASRSAVLPSADRRLLVHGLNKWYGDFHVLRDVDLTVRSGEVVVICGRSGSGKSTLIRCIAGLEPFDVGRIVVDGAELQPGSRRNYRRLVGLGMVFQGFNLFPHLSVLDNLLLGPLEVRRLPRAEARELALHHLGRLRMAEYAERYPGTLSGGQQQRVAIARALCMKPELMLFDEPTSALDPELKGEVRSAIADLASDRMTMLIVTHEFDLARSLASRVILFNDGVVVTDGTPDDFFAAGPETAIGRAQP